MANQPVVMVLYETTLQSWVRDSSAVAGFVALIGIGVWLDSSAMQWVGALLGFLTIIGRSIKMGDRNKFTVEQARKRLDEIEAQMRGGE